MKPILLLLFAATAACVGALLPLISRARSKRLLLNAVRRASSDAPDGIGISVLCSGVTDAAQIENLLSPEYSRYEVIVVLDARRHAAEFAALTARYRMIRVEWVCSGELEVSGVRALGRSRRRCFRRLVLVDRARDSEAGDFDAAASVATCCPFAQDVSCCPEASSGSSPNWAKAGREASTSYARPWANPPPC